MKDRTPAINKKTQIEAFESGTKTILQNNLQTKYVNPSIYKMIISFFQDHCSGPIFCEHDARCPGINASKRWKVGLLKLTLITLWSMGYSDN